MTECGAKRPQFPTGGGCQVEGGSDHAGAHAMAGDAYGSYYIYWLDSGYSWTDASPPGTAIVHDFSGTRYTPVPGLTESRHVAWVVVDRLGSDVDHPASVLTRPLTKEAAFALARLLEREH